MYCTGTLNAPFLFVLNLQKLEDKLGHAIDVILGDDKQGVCVCLCVCACVDDMTFCTP